MLRIFEEEQGQYGWLDAKETINCIAQHSVKRQVILSTSDAGCVRVTGDCRFQALLKMSAEALKQGPSASQTGPSKEDLAALKEDLETLQLKRTELYQLVKVRVQQERAQSLGYL